MKKITLLFSLLFITAVTNAQTYSTGMLSLFATAGLEYQAKIDVSPTEVTLTLVGPDARWLGIGFGATGMSSGDAVIFDGTNLTDRTLGGFSQPVMDAVQSWTVTSNTMASGVRTIVGTRALNTGESDDYVFTNTASSLSLVYARGQSLTIQYHGNGNCGATTTNFVLSNNEFSLEDSVIYPNPCQDYFTVKTKASLSKVSIYTQTGTFVKTIDVEGDENLEINVSGLSTGTYLLELQGNSIKTWKKIIVN